MKTKGLLFCHNLNPAIRPAEGHKQKQKGGRTKTGVKRLRRKAAVACLHPAGR